jgi:hypothetical protein
VRPASHQTKTFREKQSAKVRFLVVLLPASLLFLFDNVFKDVIGVIVATFHCRGPSSLPLFSSGMLAPSIVFLC